MGGFCKMLFFAILAAPGFFSCRQWIIRKTLSGRRSDFLRQMDAEIDKEPGRFGSDFFLEDKI
ncbi:hypothetical protein ACFO25_01965 [Paenactinomyces guangxiensis]|uniref:hypothetical protein n=1 Tax=Paenactinomyces guangxiensis TaxID=1490290 RepID=UPI0035A8CC50